MWVKCSRCGEDYRLGVNALVATFFAVADAHAAVVGSPASREATTPSSPDLIAAIPGKWSALDAVTQFEQAHAITRLERLLETGAPRWWMCNLCRMVQEYGQTRVNDKFSFLGILMGIGMFWAFFLLPLYGYVTLGEIGGDLSSAVGGLSLGFLAWGVLAWSGPWVPKELRLYRMIGELIGLWRNPPRPKPRRQAGPPPPGA